VTTDAFAYERTWAGYRKIKDPTEAQLRCLRVAGIWLDGLHHMPDTVRMCTAHGIELVFHRGKTFSTFDFNDLTRLVFVAHDQCVRAEIGARGMHTAVMLHARDTRKGPMHARHPMIEQALAEWRREHSAEREDT